MYSTHLTITQSPSNCTSLKGSVMNRCFNAEQSAVRHKTQDYTCFLFASQLLQTRFHFSKVHKNS